MSAPAKKAGDIKVSFVAARRSDGTTIVFLPTKTGLVAVETIESSDEALDLHEKLKKAKGDCQVAARFVNSDSSEGKFVQTALFVRAKVRDTVTGFSGAAVARIEYFGGHTRIAIEPPARTVGLSNHAFELRESDWFDECRVEPIPAQREGES